ncbi:MAG TPA: sugar phosphate isomerase/epimerase family protein [Bryobacteraceae bacterium]|nr:sugar phosphate isomerase/epimerase family protein [Bryobacteraceae bacterium]
MQFGVNTLLWTAAFDRSHLHLLPPIKDAGFDGVEIARFDFAGFPAAELRRETEALGLQPIFCSALTGNASIITDDTAVRSRSLAFLKDGIQVAAELGAHTFIGPYLSAVGLLHGRRRTADEWKRAVEGLQSLGDTLTSCGVTLAVEPLNRFECYSLNTAADAVALCDAVGHPNVGILYDTFHGHIEEKQTGDAIRRSGKHLKHVHTCENDRGVPGSGQVHWDEVFPALKDAGYDGWLVIESFGQNVPEIAAAACIWRDLAPSPEAIMLGGLEFLKARV